MPGCNASESNARWPHHQERVVVCDGDGSVECVKNQFCILRNVWIPPNDCSKGAVGEPYDRSKCAWRVYCKRRRDDIERFLGRGTGRREAWPPIALIDGRAPNSEGHQIFDGPAYLARRGDCGGSSPNPAHCVADVVNFYATTRAAGLIEKPTVYLGSGFNYGAGTTAWGTDDHKGMDDAVLWLAWQAGATNISNLARAPPLTNWTVVSSAVTSRPPMTAISWGPANCKAQLRSPVLASLRHIVDPYVDAIVQDRYLPHRRHHQRSFVLFAARVSPDDDDPRRRLSKRNPGQRSITNLGAIVRAATKRWPDIDMRVVVIDDTIPYPLQMALWRRARVVVGLHGGALSGALWLSPGQGLIEITPKEKSCGFPGMFAHVSVAVGAKYIGVLCDTCTMRDGGKVQLDPVLTALADLLDTNATRVAPPSHRL